MRSWIDRSWRVLATLALAISFAGLTPARPEAAETLLVFAAASLKNALDEANAAYTKATGVEVKTSYAASSALAKQLEQGAPADLFFSADLDWMDYIEERKLIRPGTRTELLRNRLVLVATKDGPIREQAMAPGLDLASLLGDGRLAMGQVESVPAGKYGKAALESLGVWPSVAGKLAQTENVRAALLLVARGEAPLGIVYQTDAAAEPGVKIVGTFPEASHPPIIYPVAATKDAKPEAAGYLTFLRGPAARAAFTRQGFTVISAGSS